MPSTQTYVRHHRLSANVDLGDFPVVQATATCERGGRLPVIPTPKVNPSKTWLEYCKDYELTLKVSGKSPATIKNRKSMTMVLARHATAAGLEPAEVTKAWMLDYLLLQKAARKGSSYPVLFQELRAFWQHLADTELMAKSPMTSIPRPQPVEEEEVPVLEPAHIVALRAACSGSGYRSARDLAILVVLYQTGLRRAELSALNWADVDLAEGLLIVRHGKGDTFRVAPLQPHSHQALHKLQRAARKLAMAGPDDPVFTSVNATTGKRLTPAGLAHVIASIGLRAGLPGLHPHQFRHTNVHQRLDQGIQEHALMILMGWTSTKQIARYGKAKAMERAIEAGRRCAVTAGL